MVGWTALLSETAQESTRVGYHLLGALVHRPQRMGMSTADIDAWMCDSWHECVERLLGKKRRNTILRYSFTRLTEARFGSSERRIVLVTKT